MGVWQKVLVNLKSVGGTASDCGFKLDMQRANGTGTLEISAQKPVGLTRTQEVVFYAQIFLAVVMLCDNLDNSKALKDHKDRKEAKMKGDRYEEDFIPSINIDTFILGMSMTVEQD